MTEGRIIRMLKELIENVDADIYDSIFINPEYPDEAKDMIENLVEIVKEYID